MFEVLKILLGLATDDTSKDALLQYYLQQARIMAEEFCNISELPERYDSTIINLAFYLYRNQDVLGYSQKTEGERSISLNSSGIPDYIKEALPKPKIMIGGA
jgi:hypothetical protein